MVDLMVEVVKLRRLSGNCWQVKLKFGVSNPTPWSEKVELVVSFVMGELALVNLGGLK